MESAKSLEKLVVSTGSVLCIDQYMLSNEQCLAAMRSDLGRSEGIRRYGGVIFSFPNAEYRVFRDPHLQLLAIANEDESACTSEDGLGTVIETFGPSAQSKGHVRIDNRCLVLSDAGILENESLLNSFTELRKADRDKEARDLLREHGAAVRYGFNKVGDELALFARSEPTAIAALWPE